MNWKPIAVLLAALWVLALVLVLWAPWAGDSKDPVEVPPTGSAAAGAGAAGDGAATAPRTGPEESSSPGEPGGVLTPDPRLAPVAPSGTTEPSGVQGEGHAVVNPQAEAEPQAGTPEDSGLPKQPDEFQRLVLKQILKPIGEASERFAKQDSLPKSRWFGEDQESNQASIDQLLDQAIDVLEHSSIGETRQKLRAARKQIEALRQANAGDREKRLSAKSESELSRLGKVLELSREDLDEQIQERELEVANQEQSIVQLEQEFLSGLEAIGLKVSPESARSLLGTVSGDDFVEMCVVFDNVRLVTEQLQELTEQGGESLAVARRYYGSYVVLIRILDRIQKDFVRRVREEQLPRLGEFAERARKNVTEAQQAARSGGDRELLEQNIRSNNLTLGACEDYARYLGEQARAVEAQNKTLELRLRDALNTYRTVELSSQVTELLREGERNFRALLELQLPELRGFENAELEREFQRLTDRLVEP